MDQRDQWTSVRPTNDEHAAGFGAGRVLRATSTLNGITS
jgi:hypothetical protein